MNFFLLMNIASPYSAALVEQALACNLGFSPGPDGG
jgi:hypothetical protein